jgi:two-component system LytT family sensor kinase
MNRFQIDMLHEDAYDHVMRLRGLYLHLTYYVVIHLGLAALNGLMTPGQPWIVWSLIGWGIGLTTHMVSVMATDQWFGPDWEARMVRKLTHENT